MGSKTALLDTVGEPADTRRFSIPELRRLPDELRSETINAVSVTGGHLGAGLGDDNAVIAVSGEGSMSAGMAYEAMNNAAEATKRLIVILNDNDMSIAPPVGGMSAYLAGLVSGNAYQRVRRLGKEVASHLPRPL